MALYRNIAGFDTDENGQIGLTLLQPLQPTTTYGTIRLPSVFQDPVAYQQQREEIAQAIWADKNAKYDWLMNHSFAEIYQAGYYVTPDNGSIFQWTDAAHTTSRAHLPIQDIQDVENDRGTAGALLMHMNQPILAKDTAGFEGGGSYSWGSTTQVSDPIPEVKEIPEPSLPDGAVPFEPVINIDIPTNGSGTTTTPTTTTTTTTTTTSTATKPDWLPIITMGGLVLTAIKGEQIFKKRRGLVFIGALGLLYWELSRKE